MTDHPTNTAIIVGRLGTIIDYVRDGKRSERVEKVAVSRYNTMRGERFQFALLMDSPLGEPFEWRLEVSSTMQGAELLATKQPGDRIAVEGFPQIVTTIDKRYALTDDDEGRSVRDMEMHVTLLREPNENEPDQASAVWLEGKVIEPPRFIRHPTVRSLQLATTLLEVHVNRVQAYRPGYPGLRRMYRDRIEVPITISVDHEQAGLLYRAGNMVRIDGEITQVILEQYGASVTAAVEAAQEKWSSEKEQLAAKSHKEQNDGLRNFRKQVTKLIEQPRSMIVVAFVEPLAGAEPLSFAQARDSRRDFVATRRRRGSAAATALATRPKAKAVTADAAGDTEAGSTPSIPTPRPRRKANDTPVIESVEFVIAPVEMMEPVLNGASGD